ncbi:hypothetical protein [Curtobacterium sp. VKM Ac-1376]|nr:hypothetical protein [Curtobacterium sp. VKM Ac-1376]MBF4616265.1 hypothetical protein [Curtobacterium sp. VKM Ac-1376]
MSELDESDNYTSETWTTRYRIPIAIGTGFLTLLCFWLLFVNENPEG